MCPPCSQVYAILRPFLSHSAVLFPLQPSCQFLSIWVSFCGAARAAGRHPLRTASGWVQSCAWGAVGPDCGGGHQLACGPRRDCGRIPAPLLSSRTQPGSDRRGSVLRPPVFACSPFTVDGGRQFNVCVSILGDGDQKGRGQRAKGRSDRPGPPSSRGSHPLPVLPPPHPRMVTLDPRSNRFTIMSSHSSSTSLLPESSYILYLILTVMLGRAGIRIMPNV